MAKGRSNGEQDSCPDQRRRRAPARLPARADRHLRRRDPRRYRWRGTTAPLAPRQSPNPTSAGIRSRRLSRGASPSSRRTCAATGTAPSPTAARTTPPTTFPGHGRGQFRGDGRPWLQALLRRRPRSRGPGRLPHGARSAGASGAAGSARHCADASRAHKRFTRLGARELPLVLHGPESSVSGTPAVRRSRLLHPVQAEQKGCRAGDLLPRGDGGVRPLHDARADPRGVRGLPRYGDARPRHGHRGFRPPQDRLPSPGDLGIKQPLRPALPARRGLGRLGRTISAASPSRPATTPPSNAAI